jgi:ABC-type multidrug transport system ATPase subunit
MRDDALLESMTVREAFEFTAKIKMGKNWKFHVQKCTEALKLQHTLDTIIGGVTSRGVSGGERKRVAIGIELLNNPKVLFMDEPTTGLDSKTALNLLMLCKTMTDFGRTVIATLL